MMAVLLSIPLRVLGEMKDLVHIPQTPLALEGWVVN